MILYVRTTSLCCFSIHLVHCLYFIVFLLFITFLLSIYLFLHHSMRKPCLTTALPELLRPLRPLVTHGRGAAGWGKRWFLKEKRAQNQQDMEMRIVWSILIYNSYMFFLYLIKINYIFYIYIHILHLLAILCIVHVCYVCVEDGEHMPTMIWAKLLLQMGQAKRGMWHPLG